MRKKNYQGVSIDSKSADAKSYPRMPARAAVQRAGHELKQDPPAILAKTRRKQGKAAAKKQRTAIMLSKARREG